MSDSTVRFLTDVALSGGISFSANYVDFPPNPQPRTMVVKDGVAYLYTELVNGSNYFSWQPISLKQTAHLHTQSTPSSTWTVTHDFNSIDFAYFVYDSTHRLMLANIQIVNANTVQILLAEAETGTAVFFSLSNISAPALTATSSVNLGSLTLRDGSGQLTVNDSPVALAADVSTAITAALSTFTASSTDANAYTDAAIAAALVNVAGNITIGSTVVALGGTTTTLAGLTSLTIAGTLKTTAFQETSVAMTALNVDLTAGNYFTKTITAISTFTVSGTPAAGTVGEFIIKLTNGAAFAVTWFTGTKWAGGIAPTLTSAGVDTLGFYTVDGGTTWYGYVLGKDSK